MPSPFSGPNANELINLFLSAPLLGAGFFRLTASGKNQIIRSMKKRPLSGKIVLGVVMLTLLGPGPGAAGERSPLPVVRPNFEIGRSAHRGASHYAPENTIPAYLKAVEQGYQWIEIDVRYSKDGAPVLHHDSWTLRSSLVALPVRAMTYSRLKKLNAGIWYGPKFRDARIPSLEEALSALSGKVNLYLDLKEPPQPELIRLLKKYGFYPDHVLVLGNQNGPKFLEFEPEAKYLAKPGSIRDIDRLLREYPSLFALNVGCQVLTPEMVDAAHARGVLVFSNVINLMPWQTRDCMHYPILYGADVTQIDNLRVFNEVVEEIRREQEVRP